MAKQGKKAAAKKPEPKLMYQMNPNSKPDGWYGEVGDEHVTLLIEGKEVIQAWEDGSITLQDTPTLSQLEAMVMAERIAHLILGKQ